MPVRQIKCKECNTVLKTSNPLQYLCTNPECRRINAIKKSQEWCLAHNPHMKLVGSRLICSRCKKEFIKQKNNQKYCLNCSNKGVWKAKLKTKLIGLEITSEIIEKFEQQLIQERKNFIDQFLKNISDKKIQKHCAEESHYQSYKATLKLVEYLKKKGIKVTKKFQERFFPSEYFDVKGKAISIKNAYFFLEHYNNGPITPMTRVFDIYIPSMIFKLFGLINAKQREQLKSIMFVVLPWYVELLLSKEKADVMRASSVDLPEYLKEIVIFELSLIWQYMEKYKDFGYLYQKVGRKTLVERVFQTERHEKQFLHFVIFDKSRPLRFFKNVYIYLDKLLEKLGKRAEELSSLDFEYVPSIIYGTFDYKRLKFSRIKYVLFDVIPKVCEHIKKNNTYPEDIPGYLLDKGLVLNDFCKLHEFTKQFLDYGKLTPRYLKILKEDPIAASPLYIVLFGSFYFDPQLKERDKQNLREFLVSCTEEELQTLFKRKKLLQHIVPNLKANKDIQAFINEEIEKINRYTAGHKIAVYFDKNVIFRFANNKVMGRSKDRHCQKLIEMVLDKKIIGVISSDCIKAVYGHLRYNLGKPEMDGGLQLKPVECELKSVEFVQKYIYPKSPWKVAYYGENVVHNALLDKKHTSISTYEDRLEFYTFLESSRELEGPTIFVSNDSHFFEPEVQKNVDKRTLDRTFHTIQSPKIAIQSIEKA